LLIIDFFIDFQSFFSRKQKKMQEELKVQKASQEESLRLYERKYASVQDELEALRKSNCELWTLSKNQKTEIDDLNREHEYEKENLLDTIRELEKDLGFYEELTDMVFTKEEIIKIRGHTLWSENANHYKIPPFLFKDKEIKFPNLTYAQGIDLVENQKNLREMEVEMPMIEIMKKEKKTQGINEDKEGFLTSQKIKGGFQGKKGIKVRPVKIMGPYHKIKEEEIIERKPKYINTLTIEDMTSPSLAERTKQKKEYLKALDNSKGFIKNLLLSIKY